MQPFGLAAIARPQMEFDIDSGGAAALSGGVSCKTALSRGPDANFLQRVVIPFALPVNPLFVPTLNIIVRDHRLGGLVTPVVGVAAVDLRARLPTRAGFGHAPAAVAEAGATESKGDADPTVADARAADASRAAVGSAPSEFLVADASAKYRGDPKARVGPRLVPVCGVPTRRSCTDGGGDEGSSRVLGGARARHADGSV